jgi:hypothetical protein
MGGIEPVDYSYSTLCSDERCTQRATVVLRYIDNQFRLLRQLGYCRKHPQRLIDAADRLSVIDTRLGQ